MEKSVRTALTAVGVTAAAAAAIAGASEMLTQSLVHEALDRVEPKLLGSAVNRTVEDTVRAEVRKRSGEHARCLRQIRTERVEIIGRDGTRLVGHWRQCEKEKRIVIAMHGWRSSWDWDFGASADFWQDAGCSVLYAEQRGQGESGGEYMGFGMIERYDCLEWVNWVNGRTAEKKRIYLAGISMGASTVLMAAGLELPENVRGIMADCGFTSPKAIWKYVMERNLRIPYGLCEKRVEDICMRRLKCGSGECSTLDALKNCRVPVLFIHGEADEFVPIGMTLQNFDACAAPKRILTVPGAGHAVSFLTAPALYKKTVLDFWKEFDG